MDWKMEYNSEKDTLIIPEYGRHVQEMLQLAKAIENDKERQAFVERIVDLMQQMQPQNRNQEDYREKLWKHAFRIGEYELNVKAPEGIDVDPADAQKHPDPVDYPEIQASYRHYGHNVQVMIKQALEMPEGHKRQAFAGVIASYMKLAYKTWNHEPYVSDEVIKADLEKLSEGRLSIPDNVAVENLVNTSSQQQSRSSNSGSNNRGSNRRSGGSRSNNNNNNRSGGRRGRRRSRK